MNILTVKGENSNELSILKEAQGERNGKVDYSWFINHSLFSEWRMELCLLLSLKCMVLVLIPLTGQLCDPMMLGMQGEGTIYASFIADVLLTAPCLYTKLLGQLDSTEQNWRPKVPETGPHFFRRAFLSYWHILWNFCLILAPGGHTFSSCGSRMKASSLSCAFL